MTNSLDAGAGAAEGAGPSTAPEETPQAPAVGPSIAQAINNAVRSAPELKQDPGTAVAVAAAGGTTLKAQAVAQAGKRQANAAAQDQTAPTGTGIFGELGHVAGSALGKVAHYANDALSTVQHEYRYLHDVEARHGMTAAVMEGAGILAGAAAGTVLEPGEGTVLGAEAAAYLEGQVAFKDSWQRTLNPNYKDPHTGQLVSFGRDVASYFGLRGGDKTVVSGALDGLGDLIADPLANVGKGLGAAHDLEGMGGVLGTRYKGLSITAENVDQAYSTLPSVRRAFSDIAGMSPGDIAARYPQFVGIANELGAASTANEVRDTFRDLAASSEMLDAQKLPTLAASRVLFRPLRDVVRNLPDDAEGPVSGFLARHTFNNSVIGPRRWADRLEALPGATFDPDTMDLSGSQINPANTRGLTDIYRMVRYSGTDREARAVVDAYAAATPAQRITIVKNATFATLFRMAGEHLGPDENYEDALDELVDGRTKAALLERLDNHLSSAAIEGNQPERVFATMTNGQVVRPVLDDEGVAIQGAIRSNQTGNISLPNIVEARRMAAAIKNSRTSRVAQGVDDFLYDHVTQGFFKPLVLMSGGYGLHISMAEAIPNTLRHGLSATARGLYDRAIANLGYKADKDELGALSGWLYNTAGQRALSNSQDAQYLTEVYLANEGYKTTTGVAAGEITQGETQPVERAIRGFRQKMATSTKEGSEFSTFGNEDPRIVKLWQADLREAANDRWTREAAGSYLASAKKGLGEQEATELARQHVAEALRDEPQSVLDTYVRSQYKSATAPVGWDPIDDWAQSIVDALKTDVHARPGGGRRVLDAMEGVTGYRTHEQIDRFAADVDAAPDDALIRVHHVTHSPESAAEITRGGRVSVPPGSVRNDSALPDHLYVSSVADTGNDYGAHVVPLVVRKRDLVVPPESEGRTLGHALNSLDDGAAIRPGAAIAKGAGGFGEAGKLHVDLLQSVANGHTPEAEDLAKIDPSERPLALKGRQVIPDGTGAVQRIANFGFRKILNPMVNIISRNQEFAVEYVQARRALQPMVDAGKMTDAEAMIRAESQTTTHVMRFVHNLHDRTQWTATMRNWAPFYFAQEQAYRRMGRLLAEDPGAFRRYQMMIAGISHLSAQMQDTNGNQYIAFPGSGFIGQGVADAMGLHGVMVGNVTPAAFGGSLSSANVIFPLSQGFTPDLGPVAVLPAQFLDTHLLELGRRYPQFAKATNVAASALSYVEGPSSQSEPIWEQLIPNAFVSRIVQAYTGDDRAFNSSVMQAYQYLAYQQNEAMERWEKDGKKGTMPDIIPAQTASADTKQAFVDKVRNYVRALYVARAITGVVSPVSSEVEIQNFGFPAKLNDEITKAGSVNQGMANFLHKYPNAVPWTVAQSYVPSDTDRTQPSGISLASSEPAMAWIDQNQALLDKHGAAALWLMPQLKDSKYSPTVYNEQIAQGLRVKDSPQQFLNALYVAAGDDMYYDGLSVHEAALQAAGNNKTQVNAEYDNWDAWVTQLEKQYPVWAENFTSGTRQTNAQQAIQGLTAIFNAHEAPAGEQSELVKALLANYQVAAAEYQQAGAQSDYYSAQSQVADSWVAYLDSVSQSHPQLKPIIQTVFKNALKVQT